MFPTMLLSDIRLGEFASTTSGSVVSVVREHGAVLGVALGDPGAPPTHFLTDEDGMPTVYDFADFGNHAAVQIGLNLPLFLDIGKSEFHADRLPHRVGQLALTREGLMVGASGGMDGFRRHALTLVSLSSFNVAKMAHDVRAKVRWLPNWALSVRGALDVVVRVVGNPEWPDAARVRR